MSFVLCKLTIFIHNNVRKYSFEDWKYEVFVNSFIYEQIRRLGVERNYK
jgi:hypothetical protein